MDVKMGATNKVLEWKRGTASDPKHSHALYLLSILIHKMVTNGECWGLRARQLPVAEDVGVSEGERWRKRGKHQGFRRPGRE